jgi:hypothetical protein
MSGAGTLAEYLLPVHANIPDIDIVLLDRPDLDANPIGVKRSAHAALRLPLRMLSIMPVGYVPENFRFIYLAWFRTFHDEL